jgi:hypothetical protein
MAATIRQSITLPLHFTSLPALGYGDCVIKQVYFKPTRKCFENRHMLYPRWVEFIIPPFYFFGICNSISEKFKPFRVVAIINRSFLPPVAPAAIEKLDHSVVVYFTFCFYEKGHKMVKPFNSHGLLPVEKK